MASYYATAYTFYSTRYLMTIGSGYWLFRGRYCLLGDPELIEFHEAVDTTNCYIPK